MYMIHAHMNSWNICWLVDSIFLIFQAIEHHFIQFYISFFIFLQSLNRSLCCHVLSRLHFVTSITIRIELDALNCVKEMSDKSLENLKAGNIKEVDCQKMHCMHMLLSACMKYHRNRWKKKIKHRCWTLIGTDFLSNFAGREKKKLVKSG